jgi:hypothetical protein
MIGLGSNGKQSSELMELERGTEYAPEDFLGIGAQIPHIGVARGGRRFTKPAALELQRDATVRLQRRAGGF